MMFTTRMIQLFAVVLRKDCERVTEALLRQGVMQFISTSEIEGEKAEAPSPAVSEKSLTEIADMRKRIEGLLHTVGTIPAPPKEADLSRRAAVNIEKEGNRLDRIDSDRAGVRERQRAIQQEIIKLEDIQRQMGLYGDNLSALALPARHSFISVNTGKIPAANAARLDDGLKDLPSLTLAVGREEGVVHYLLISMKRDRESVQRVLESTGWVDIELPKEVKSVKADAVRAVSAQLTKLTADQKKLEAEAKGIVKKDAERLQEVWVSLRVTELLHRIQTHFTSLSRTAVFMGWLPAERRASLTEVIRRATGGRCYMEWHEADSQDVIDEDVPVRFRNPKILAPFQMLVSNFGIPRYGTIDPTPVVMPLYLAMFGLMFADVGHGLILAMFGVLGVYLLRAWAGKEGFYQLSWLIIWCGLSSVLFGVLFGSFFGLTLFPPLWFNFHGIVAGHGGGGAAVDSVYDILAITIYFGISVIALGLLFNWVNILRSRRWMELLFDKGGVFGGWIYAGGVYIAFYLVSYDYKRFPSSATMFLLVGLPALLLFLKEPYHYLRHEGRGPAGRTNPAMAVLNFLMSWIVELLEIFGGYLSNTLSFMRVAGLGIAHVCLMISFFTLAEMTSGIGSIVILILGNMLVIALEGLSAGIQALRLSYYEFFTKFFHGTGTLYTPISLNSEL